MYHENIDGFRHSVGISQYCDEMLINLVYA
jgi:hypothetical protein